MTNILFSTLVFALGQIESGGDDKAVSPDGKCWGRYQLTATYIKDANRITGRKWGKADAFKHGEARKMVLAVLQHYYRPGMTVQDMAIVHKSGIGAWRITQAMGFTPDEIDYKTRTENTYNDTLRERRKE